MQNFVPDDLNFKYFFKNLRIFKNRLDYSASVKFSVPKILNFIIENLTINCPKVLYKILSHSGINSTDSFGRIYLSFFLYISNVKVEWPPANSKCGCKNRITDFN